MTQILSFPAHATNVADLAQRRLRESPYFFLKNIHCEFDGGVLTLRGSVPLWQLRQFAESIVSRVEGVSLIDNQVEVSDPELAPLSAPGVRNAG